jgi:hypothetical protein
MPSSHSATTSRYNTRGSARSSSSSSDSFAADLSTATGKVAEYSYATRSGAAGHDDSSDGDGGEKKPAYDSTYELHHQLLSIKQCSVTLLPQATDNFDYGKYASFSEGMIGEGFGVGCEGDGASGLVCKVVKGAGMKFEGTP